jgi:subtilisin family serine protease
VEGKAMTRKTRVLVIASILVSVILIEGQVFARDEEERNEDEKERKKIVVFRDNTPLEVQETVVRLSGSTVVLPLSFINAWAIELPDVGTANALAFLLNYTVLGVPIVVGAYDDLVVSVLPITPAPPPLQQTYGWGLKHIRVDDAHDKMPQVTGRKVQVAILDTGVGPHAQLTIVDGYNALPGGVPNLYSDDHGHGTHMAGIIAASVDSGVGIIGAAPEADIVAVKVLDFNGKGSLSTVINGLQWVYNYKKIRLVNMSLGFSTAVLHCRLPSRNFLVRAPLWWPLPETAAQMTQAKTSQGERTGKGQLVMSHRPPTSNTLPITRRLLPLQP